MACAWVAPARVAATQCWTPDLQALRHHESPDPTPDRSASLEPMDKPAKPTRITAAAASQPLHLQVAALCWRRSAKGLRILLITSRDTGRGFTNGFR